MGRNGRTLAALAAIGTTLALTPAASAQEEVTPKFSIESDYAVGDNNFKTYTAFGITVEEGTCPGGPVSVESNGGFWTSFHVISMRGTFGQIGGTYTATLKCKDTTKAGTVVFKLTEPPPRTDQFLDKAEYAPGETIKIFLVKGYKCATDGLAHSAGFTAPAKLKMSGPNDYSQAGQTTAVDEPGTYEAKIRCWQGTAVVNTFTIKAKATPPPGPGPKPPIVKPKGAPQTGGGGTA